MGSTSTVSTSHACTTALMAGAAENVITPTTELEVYEDLYARALVLVDSSKVQTQENTISYLVIVSLDQLGCAYYEIVLKAISRATGIPTDSIFLNYSHSHNALGPVGEWNEENQPSTAEFDIPYEEWLGDDIGRLGAWDRWLVGHIAEVVKRAFLAVRPATLHVGRAPAQIGYNRRKMQTDGRIRHSVNLDGAVVPWVDAIGVFGEDGERIATMFSHAAHPVIVHHDWKNGIHSVLGPDYPGYAVKHLKNLLSAEGKSHGVLMFAQACGGDVNGYPRACGDPNACDAAGLSLAFSTRRALDNLTQVTPTSIRGHSLTLSLPRRLPTVAECKAWLNDPILHDPSGPDYGTGNIERLLDMAERGEREYLDLPIQAFAIGSDLCLLMLPGEMFCEYQLYAEDMSPFAHTVVLGYINFSVSYVGTKKDYELPGLTGGHGIAPHTNTPLEPSVEATIKQGVGHLLTELKTKIG
ncbi:MAG: hypothetical protein OXT74_09335 [Candidatus Poribacteria bacterium]|nr:hypothetical protein [Candidatus Poribacteria bacterium]